MIWSLVALGFLVLVWFILALAGSLAHWCSFGHYGSERAGGVKYGHYGLASFFRDVWGVLSWKNMKKAG